MSNLRPLVFVALLLSSSGLLLPGAGRAQTPDIPEEEAPARPEPKAEPEERPPAEEAPAEAEPPKSERRATPKPRSRSQDSRASARQTAQPEATSVAPVPSNKRRKNANLRLGSTLSGETGVLRVGAADASEPGTLRLSFGLDFFSTGSFFAENDGHSRVGGTLALTAVPIDYLELWLATRAQSSNNEYTQPRLLQSQGDLTLGLKAFYPFAQLASVGADLQITLLSGIGETSFDFGATQLSFRAMLTSDFSKAIEAVPLRFHLNLGAVIDNSKNLLTVPLSNAERFALGISDYNRFAVGLALEAPFKYLTPYVEYGLEIPFGYLATPGIILSSSQALTPAQTTGPMARICDLEDDTSCARPAVQRALPQKLALGARITAIDDFTIDAAVEIGLTPDVATGIVATPPYNLVLLASYAFDPFHARQGGGPPISVPVLVPEVTEVEKTPVTGSVIGLIKSKGDGKEIQGAVVSFDRAPPVATSAAGMFRSHELEPGPVAITVIRDGYETATGKADVVAGQSIELAMEMIPAVREGVIRGHVVDDKDKPLAGINVQFLGPTNTSAVSAEDGAFERKVIAGKYSVEAVQEGYLKKAREIEVKGGETYSAEMIVRKRPKQAVAEISRGMIVVKQTVHFVTGEARLAPDAAAVLDNVVDLLVANKQIKKVRIEGHTDNVGSDETNLQLSRDRAAAVLEYLAQQGIDRTRLSAEGYGAAKPIAPNLTRRGREQNRRVEFHIVEG